MAEEKLPWQVLDRRELLRTPWRTFVVERVRTHTGEEIDYSFVETHDAVYVVPLTADGRIVLIRQYRHPLRSWVWEVPAGGVGDEPPEATARRELAEEIGGTAADLHPVGSGYFGSVAHLNLRNHVFLATGVVLGESRPEATELLQRTLVDAETAIAWARSGRLDDGPSSFAILLAEPTIREHLDGLETLEPSENASGSAPGQGARGVKSARGVKGARG